MDFGYIWLSGFREKSRLKVWTDDGGCLSYKLLPKPSVQGS